MEKQRMIYPPAIRFLTPCFLLTVRVTATLLLFSTTTMAAVITVNTDPAGSGCTIIDAIDSANGDSATGGCALVMTGTFGDDTIVLPVCNTIHTLFAVNNTTDGPNGLPTITSNITVEGNHGIIQRFAVGSTPNFRLFHVATGGTLTLNNLTLRKGVADDGNQSTITSTDFGAAIYNKGTLTLNGCTVTDNSSYRTALYNQGTAVVGKSLIEHNTNSGIENNSGGQLTIKDCTIADNGPGSGGGGGVINTGGGNTLISRTTFTGNMSGYGGAVWNAAHMTIRDSTISGNAALNSGGGLEAAGALETTLINVTISDNAARDGGGLYHSSGTLNLVNTLIAGNHLHPSGGSGVEIKRKAGTPAVGNQLNNLLGQSGITSAEAFDGFTPTGSDITATSDGSTPTPLGQILEGLQKNGGFTQTHALPPGSPAINAAISTYSTGTFFLGEGCASTIFFPSLQTVYRNDQRGVSRPQKKTCDIGAYELKKKSFFVIPHSGGKAVIFEL